MLKNNFNRWETTKLQIVEIILPAYTHLSKRCISYINQIDHLPQYLADKLRDLTEAIMSSYYKFKENSSDLKLYK